MPFAVMDANGCLKSKPGGAGASLPDPLTVPHGGTGLTQIDQSEMIYALNTDQMARLYVDTDNGTTPWKVMFNGGSVLANGAIIADNGPRWGKLFGGGLYGNAPYVGRPASFLDNQPRVFWSVCHAGTTTNFQDVGMTTSAGGTQTNVTDATSTFCRFTTPAADTTNVAGWNSPVLQPYWPAHQPSLSCYFRTGSSITNVRFAFAFCSGSLTGNTDDQSGKRVVGIRYYTTASDSGFTPFTADGIQQTVGTSIANIAASTTYVLKIDIGPRICTFWVGDVSQTMSTPTAILNLAIGSQLGIKSTDAGNTKFIDISAVYTECQVS